MGEWWQVRLSAITILSVLAGAAVYVMVAMYPPPPVSQPVQDTPPVVNYTLE